LRNDTKHYQNYFKRNDVLLLTYDEQKASIARLNLMDNGFFQKVMQDTESCEEMLQILLQMPNLKVLTNQIERNIPNMTGHAVTLDLICEDDNGNIINVEVQKANDTNHQKRVRYNMACMDTLSIDKGKAYHELPDLYVIFISSFDLFKLRQTTYRIRRVIEDTTHYVENGTHEIYVNTKVDDGSNIAQLMQYFKNSSGIHPLFPKLSSQIHYYKETPEGVTTMGDVWEEYADEKVAKQAKEMAIALLKKNIMTLAEIAELTKLSIEEVNALQQEHLQNA